MSLGVAAFYTMMLTVLSGYSYGAAMLLVGSLLVLGRGNRSAHALSTQDKTLYALLLAFFVVTLIALRRVPIRLEWLWSGLALGLLGAWRAGAQHRLGWTALLLAGAVARACLRRSLCTG